MAIKVGLVGHGYWGRNLIRNILSQPEMQLVAVADANAASLQAAARNGLDIQLFADGMELLDFPGLEAVVIATPLRFHYPLARKALDLGLHVLVEKPLAGTAAEAHDLAARAKKAGRVLLTDHTFLFSGPVETMRELRDQGALGDITYLDSMRVNLGLFQADTNVLWDLGAHDLAIVDYLLDEMPVHISANGYCHVNPGLPDIVYLTLYYASGKIAHLNMSWMSPMKVRRLAVGGSQRMLVWDDLDREQRIRIYDAGIEVRADSTRETLVPDYRIGDIIAPRISTHEPLAKLMAHFAALMTGATTQSPVLPDRAVRVVEMLEQVQKVLDVSLKEVAAVTAPKQS